MWCILENICITHVTTCNSSFLIIRSAPAWWLFHRIFKYSRSIEYTRTAHRYIYIYIYIYVYAHTPPTMLTRDRMLGNRPFGHGLPTKIHFIFLSCVFPILFFPSLPHSLFWNSCASTPETRSIIRRCIAVDYRQRVTVFLRMKCGVTGIFFFFFFFFFFSDPSSGPCVCALHLI